MKRVSAKPQWFAVRKPDEEREFRACPDSSGSTLVLAALALTASIGIALMIATPANAEPKSRSTETDTEHLFGFTEGTDIGENREREFESDSTFLHGKQGGAYASASSELEYKYTAFPNFRISGAAAFAYYDISGVTGLADRRDAALQSLSFNARYRLLDRATSPFGLTFSIEPHYGFADEVTGVPINHFGVESLLRADRELLPDRLFGALNLHYDTDRSRLVSDGVIEHEAILGGGAALAAQVRPGLWLGGEARYLQAYDGDTLNTLTGQAFYAGPTLYYKLGTRAWISAALNFQVWGSAVGIPGALDLSNFERYQAKFRIGYTF